MSDKGKERRLPPGWEAIMMNAREDASLGPAEIQLIVEELLALSRKRRVALDMREEQREV